MPTFGYDGFQISYEQIGRKRGSAERPIVLLHGLLFPRTHHYLLAEALAERGNRVILMDLLGHGDSAKPTHLRHYTMEIFGRQVIGLLDHLDIPEAVIGGTSLGANVSLEATNHAPNRVKGMFLEMPVLERAAPAAALLFIPLTILYAEAAPAVKLFARAMRRVPRGMSQYWDVMLELLSRDPEPSAAILHGLLTGRLAPHHDDRQKMDQPTLIVAHNSLTPGTPDVLHPFSDAEALHRELPNSELVPSRNFFELRFAPNRLSERIADFLDEVWSI